MGKFDYDGAERDCVRQVSQNGNTVSAKKIYLKAKRLVEGDIPGVTSAGLVLWSAIDFLVNYKGYMIVYEVPGDKKNKR